MNNLRVLIVDDEELARRGLEIRLNKMDGVEIVGQSRNGREALQAVGALAPDVILLDIQMPGMDGFDLLRALAGSDMPVVIFVTAFDRYAIRAFEANALDYLLKPIDQERLEASVARARRSLEARAAVTHRSRLLKLICELTGEDISLDRALEAPGPGLDSRYPDRLAIRDGATTACVDIRSIDWIDAAGDYMCVHSAGRTYVMRGTMKRLEEMLDPAIFVRIHRSTIVNRGCVIALRSHINGEYFLTLSGDKEVKLSRKYKDRVERIAESLHGRHKPREKR